MNAFTSLDKASNPFGFDKDLTSFDMRNFIHLNWTVDYVSGACAELLCDSGKLDFLTNRQSFASRQRKRVQLRKQCDRVEISLFFQLHVV